MTTPTSALIASTTVVVTGAVHDGRSERNADVGAAPRTRGSHTAGNRIRCACRGEGGAAAVEFALILPLLLLLVLGIVDFGRAYNVKVTVTHAAREAARVLAITGDPLQAVSVAEGAASGTEVSVTPGLCVAGEPATVTVTHAFSFITPLTAVVGGAGPSGAITIASVGSMRCGG